MANADVAADGAAAGPNRDVIDKWVTALESGEYTQTTGKLHRVAGFEDADEGITRPAGMCCLGVLCDLAVKAGVISEPVKAVRDGDEYMRYSDRDGFSSSDFPPRTVWRWAGLDGENPTVSWPRAGCDLPGCEYCGSPGSRFDELSQLNDTYKKTFPEIAQIIRDNFLAKEEVAAAQSHPSVKAEG